MLRKLYQGKRGFTLIELVLVISIVGILAAIILPKFLGQEVQAKVATTKANLESLRSAIRLYAADNEGVYPGADLTDLVSNYVRAIPKDGVLKQNTVVNTQGNAGGWYYNTTTYEVLPNLTGNDANGDAYSSY